MEMEKMGQDKQEAIFTEYLADTNKITLDALDEYQRRVNAIFKEGLATRGVKFSNDGEFRRFVAERCSARKYKELKHTHYLVDGELFLVLSDLICETTNGNPATSIFKLEYVFF